MGTYTTNYNLFLPTIGEQGWGELVNTNFSTIDNTMSGLNTRVGTLETEMDAVEERVTTLEAGNFESVTANTFNGGYIVGDYIYTDNPSLTIYKILEIPSASCSGNSSGGSVEVCRIDTSALTGKPLGIGVVGGRFKGSSLTFTVTASVTNGIWQPNRSYANLYLNGAVILSFSSVGTKTVTVNLIEGENIIHLSSGSGVSGTTPVVSATVSAMIVYAEQYIP